MIVNSFSECYLKILIFLCGKSDSGPVNGSVAKAAIQKVKRWGGGISLLLSGPGAELLIADNASEKQLGIFGLIEPRMKIDLTLENSKTIQIDVGDSTPDAQGFYVRLRHAKVIYTVHETWYHILERLVLEPPYPDPEEKPKPVDPKVQEKGNGKIPNGNDTIQVNYTGRLIEGTIFDSSQQGEPLTFGLDKIIRGWREVLQLMREGAHWEVVLSPELAYGKRGSGPKIGPNQSLVFEIELIEVK